MTLAKIAWLSWLFAATLFFGGVKMPILILLLIAGGFVLSAVSILLILFSSDS